MLDDKVGYKVLLLASTWGNETLAHPAVLGPCGWGTKGNCTGRLKARQIKLVRKLG